MKLPTRLLVIFLLALLGVASLATAQPVALTILHSNDTHGHLLPFSYPDSAASGTELQGLRVYQRHTPAVSGIKYRVQSRELVDVSIGGLPLDDNRTYTGVTNSYFAGYALKGLSVQDTGKPRIDTLIAYIRQKGTIRPAYDGRRIVTDR